MPMEFGDIISSSCQGDRWLTATPDLEGSFPKTVLLTQRHEQHSRRSLLAPHRINASFKLGVVSEAIGWDWKVGKLSRWTGDGGCRPGVNDRHFSRRVDDKLRGSFGSRDIAAVKKEF